MNVPSSILHAPSSHDPEFINDELHGVNVCFLIVAVVGIGVMLLPFFLVALVTGQLFSRRHGRRLAPAQACVLGPVTEHHRPSRPTPFNTPSVPAEVLELNNKITKEQI